MPTSSLRPLVTALSLGAALLLAACGGGGGGEAIATLQPVASPAPLTNVRAAQPCSAGSPYTLMLVNSGDIPNDTLERMVCTFFEVYPQVMVLLSNPDAPKTVVFEFKSGYEHVAAATNFNTLTYNIEWLKGHPTDSDIVVHEIAHIVQAGRGQVPSWVLEGTADFVRDRLGLRNIENGWSLPIRYDGTPYTSGYGAAAAFFKWVDAVYRQNRPGVAETLYQSANTQLYQDSQWVDMTGQTLETLWSEYRNQPVATQSTSGVSVFMASNYRGYAVRLERGRHDLGDLLSRAVPDNEIASIRVPAGYKVKAYAEVGFAGDVVELTADTPALAAGMARRISSVVVE